MTSYRQRNRAGHKRVSEREALEITGRINDVNRKDKEGGTSLAIAVGLGNEKLTELYLRSGANVNTQNASGDTPSHVAARIRRFDMLQLLDKYDADWSIKNDAGHDVLTVAKLSERTATRDDSNFVTNVRSLERGQSKQRQLVAAWGNQERLSWMNVMARREDNDVRPSPTDVAPLELASEHIEIVQNVATKTIECNRE